MPSYQKDFHWVPSDEPHASRRKEILKKYPGIVQLYGTDITTFYAIVTMFLVQMNLAYLVSDSPYWMILLVAYVAGTMNHSLSLAVHELSHNLVFQKPFYNQLAGMFANLVQGVPSAILFKKYHMEHHLYQGVNGIDTDLPTRFEGEFFCTTSRKILWMILQPIWYGLRPLVVRPKDPCVMQIANFVLQITFDYLVFHFWGFKALFYLISGTLLSMGIHPVAGHFIAEHYEFVEGVETYSYYGPLNWVSFNVGYHNEHHDFPRIPGSRLPRLREIAPEYYNTLPQHTSWVKVIWDFIFNPNITPFSRVQRKSKRAIPDSESE